MGCEQKNVNVDEVREISKTILKNFKIGNDDKILEIIRKLDKCKKCREFTARNGFEVTFSVSRQSFEIFKIYNFNKYDNLPFGAVAELHKKRIKALSGIANSLIRKNQIKKFNQVLGVFKDSLVPINFGMEAVKGGSIRFKLYSGFYSDFDGYNLQRHQTNIFELCRILGIDSKEPLAKICMQNARVAFLGIGFSSFSSPTLKLYISFKDGFIPTAKIFSGLWGDRLQAAKNNFSFLKKISHLFLVGYEFSSENKNFEVEMYSPIKKTGSAQKDLKLIKKVTRFFNRETVFKNIVKFYEMINKKEKIFSLAWFNLKGNMFDITYAA